MTVQLEAFDYFVDDVWVAYGQSATPVVKGVGIGVNSGGITALIGESGSGKTSLARALLGTLPASAEVKVGRTRLPKRLGFVQQEASASLHPLRPIGLQIADIIAARRGRRSRATRDEATQLLGEIGLQPVEMYYGQYAHRLSGGQMQRVAVARAIASRADFIIADEPTSQLDLITQADVMKVLHRAIRRHSMGLLLITHDLRLVAEVADWVAVLHHGEVVDFGEVADVWRAPQHAYTEALLAELALSGGRHSAEQGVS